MPSYKETIKAAQDPETTKLILDDTLTREEITEVIKELEQNPYITEIEIHNNPNITNATLLELTKSSTIKSLYLWYQPGITDEGMEALANSKTLEFLILESIGKITDEGIKTLANSKTLKKLRLDRMRNITDKGITALANSKTLESIELVGDNFTDREIEALAKSDSLLEIKWRPDLPDPMPQEVKSKLRANREREEERIKGVIARCEDATEEITSSFQALENLQSTLPLLNLKVLNEKVEEIITRNWATLAYVAKGYWRQRTEGGSQFTNLTLDIQDIVGSFLGKEGIKHIARSGREELQWEAKRKKLVEEDERIERKFNPTPTLKKSLMLQKEYLIELEAKAKAEACSQSLP